ncbi:MAG: HEAT repeat domain-containing protein [Elainella sp. Prado103]|nr:HEAT repeat domain-containing protein [Elainella sp. Prado103]
MTRWLALTTGLAVGWGAITLESVALSSSHQTRSNQTRSNQTRSNQAQSNQAQSILMQPVSSGSALPPLVVAQAQAPNLQPPLPTASPDRSISPARASQSPSTSPPSSKPLGQANEASQTNHLPQPDVPQTVNAPQAEDTSLHPASQLGGWLVAILLPIVAIGSSVYAVRRSPKQTDHSSGDRSDHQLPTDPTHPSPLAEEAAPQAVQTHMASPLLAGSPVEDRTAASQTAPSPLESPLERTAAPIPEPQLNRNSAISPTINPTLSPTTRLPKIDPVMTLIAELHSSDRVKRQNAIWQLGQAGDSRALQPLTDLLVDLDSQQRSLVLAAISEIGARTIKPMNRALLLSLQDDSPEVRKNAIRDISRVYDLMIQISQSLHYAANDADTEVQETARWALTQLNRVRSLPKNEQVAHLSEHLPKEKTDPYSEETP